MEEEEQVQRLVVSRPVAYRPSCSRFGFFSGLLAGDADDSSSPCSFPRAATVIVRPSTIRLNPSVRFTVGDIQTQTQGVKSGSMATYASSDVVLKPEGRSNVVYKPSGKLVSRAAASLLANPGNFDEDHPSPPSYSSPTATQSQLDKGLDLAPAPARAVEQSSQLNNTATTPVTGSDRLSFDWYNWKKYGQKQVKRSEYPRSYYKCSSPNCPVKKKVEMTLDGQIAEIVYKGEHNHPKLQPPKRVQGRTHFSEGDQDCHGKKNAETEGKLVKQNQLFSLENNNPMDIAHDNGTASPENSYGFNGESEEANRAEDGHDQPLCKRRRKEKDVSEGSVTVQDSQAAAHTSADSEILQDGFRWRKYGQKVIKGNPYPRSYYRCTSLNCNVRKLVERSLVESGAFITTYEGKHNHEMPGIRSSNPDMIR